MAVAVHCLPVLHQDRHHTSRLRKTKIQVMLASDKKPNKETKHWGGNRTNMTDKKNTIKLKIKNIYLMTDSVILMSPHITMTCRFCTKVGFFLWSHSHQCHSRGNQQWGRGKGCGLFCHCLEKASSASSRPDLCLQSKNTTHIRRPVVYSWDKTKKRWNLLGDQSPDGSPHGAGLSPQTALLRSQS